MKLNTSKKRVVLSIVSICIILLIFALASKQEDRFVIDFFRNDKGASYEVLDDEKVVIDLPTRSENHEAVIIEDEEIPLAPLSYLAKDAGLVPNDKSKAAYNADQLIKALNRSNKIIIDDSYYISTPYETLTTRTVEISGTDKGELISDDERSIRLFDTSVLKSLTFKNVKFTNDNKSALLIVYNDDRIGTKVDTVDVQECIFNGNISLYRQYGKTDLDPDNIDYGVGDFIFKDNKVSNTRYSFIVLNDIPVDFCEIRDNTIQNFQYKFLNIGITNEQPFEYKLYDHIKYLEVENNKVVCDDAWWGDTASGSYYTFVLYEGDEVLYNNNHVEGMKTLGKFAVYDAYLSARVVNYTNNTWKNNICFASDKLNNTLLKSKGGGSDSLVRNYSGNKFIIEEDFAGRVGQSKDNLFVNFISLTRRAESYSIKNNLFDVYDLRFPASSMSIGDLAICGNTVKAKKASGNLAIVRLEDDYTSKSIDISDNIIDIDAKSNSTFNLVKSVDNRKSATENIKNICVKNNKITAPLGYIFYDAIADNLDFSDNTIIDSGSGNPGLAYMGKFVQSNISDNLIKSLNSSTFYEGRQLYGAGPKKEILNLTRNNTANGSNGLHLDIGYNSEVPTIYKRTYTFDTETGVCEFYYTFTLSYDSKNNCANVTFVNNKGETSTYKLGVDSSAKNGDGQFVEIVDKSENGSENPYKVRFYNSKGKAVFYITDYSYNFCEMKIETVSYQND